MSLKRKKKKKRRKKINIPNSIEVGGLKEKKTKICLKLFCRICLLKKSNGFSENYKIVVVWVKNIFFFIRSKKGTLKFFFFLFKRLFLPTVTAMNHQSAEKTKKNEQEMSQGGEEKNDKRKRFSNYLVLKWIPVTSPIVRVDVCFVPQNILFEPFSI